MYLNPEEILTVLTSFIEWWSMTWTKIYFTKIMRYFTTHTPFWVDLVIVKAQIEETTILLFLSSVETRKVTNASIRHKPELPFC